MIVGKTLVQRQAAKSARWRRREEMSGRLQCFLSAELGISRGTIAARGQELREGALLPVGGRGIHAEHLGIEWVNNWLVCNCIAPKPNTAAKLTRAAKALPRCSDSDPVAFGDLTVAWARTLGEAMQSLCDDAVSGRLQAWKNSRGSLVVDFVDAGRFVSITATKDGVGEIGFARPNTHPKAPSAFRVFRLDSRIFEQIAVLMNRTTAHDPHTGH
jgi:hypothetical protein